MYIEGMSSGYLSHNDEKREQRHGDDGKGGGDRVTRMCDYKGGMRKGKRKGKRNEMKRM